MTAHTSGDFAIGDDLTTRVRRDAPPYRHQRIATIDAPEAIPAEVHDEPAVRRRVGADAYRAQRPDAIAAALTAAVVRDTAARRKNAKDSILRALAQVTTDRAWAERISDETIAGEIKAGRL